MDGIDVALIRTDGENIVERGPSLEFAYDTVIRREIAQGLSDAREINDDRTARPGDLKLLEAKLTDLHGQAVNSFVAQNSLSVSDVDVIGFHGQTVLHRPQMHLTVQIGDGARLAEMTGIDVIYDMRAADMVAGGQGAPLVPVYHRALANALPRDLRARMPVAFVNIGGIANITYVPQDGELIAFDTGPGNGLIDQWVQSIAGIPFDQGGKIASEGGVIQSMLDRYMSASYFNNKLPKSLDRNDFLPPQSHEAEFADGARTLVRLSAMAIFAALEHLPAAPKLWIICGGGRKNQTIMQDLRELAKNTNASVISAETAGFDGDAMEAEAFAYLAVRALKSLPLTYPSTTGCTSAQSGGVLATHR